VFVFCVLKVLTTIEVDAYDVNKNRSSIVSRQCQPNTDHSTIQYTVHDPPYAGQYVPGRQRHCRPRGEWSPLVFLNSLFSCNYIALITVLDARFSTGEGLRSEPEDATADSEDEG
jgi:hypothetical protein